MIEVPRSRLRSAATILAAALLALMPARTGSASMLQVIPSSPTLLPGGSETVSVLFTSTQNFNLTASDIEIAFDATRFTVSNVQLGSLVPTANGFNITAGISTGLLQVTIDTNSPTGTPVTTGTVGTIETFTLTALANAPLGGSLGNINLLATAGRASTDVFTDPTTSGAIVLTPAPTNGYDPTLDGTVLIGAAVPEPSSIVLLGLGGGVAGLATLLRKRARRSPAA